MGNFECKTVEDLLFNRSFRNWVLDRNSPESEFWENWVTQHPEKKELINNAKSIVYALQLNFRTLEEEVIQGEINKVLQRLENRSDEATDLDFERKRKGFIKLSTPARWSLTLVAASFILFFFIFIYRNNTPSGSHFTYGPLTADATRHPVVKINNSDTAQLIVLPDSSKVYLKSRSTLTYAQESPVGGTREIYLDGEAFFEIKRDFSKPFFVLTRSIITKVLGTSFLVKAYSSDKKAEVLVKTGKVSVFKTDNFNDSISKGDGHAGILVTPNQDVVYNSDNNEMHKTLTEKPALIIEPLKTTFVFDATPINKVFKTMQDAYGIPIVYEEDVISTCSLSATMAEGTFYEKLDIICKAINATYETVDGNIIILSNGCHK